MTTTSVTRADVWATIEKEKRRDRFIRRTSVVAWTGTFAIVLVYAAIVVARVMDMMRLTAVGMVRPGAALEAAVPLVTVLGLLSVLVATLSTIGIFLRLRTASLIEIQLRLTALEDMLRSGDQES